MSGAPHTAVLAPSTTSGSSRRQQRASHTVVSSTAAGNSHGQTHDDEVPSTPDVYSHPAAVAYTAAHPRRTIPKFGPYLLLQTLGEGEFGKVKLGLHNRWGEEVAVKLIRRGNVDGTLRMSKVEREIEVLKVLVFYLEMFQNLTFTLDTQTSQHRSFIRCYRNRQIHWNYSGICLWRGTFRPHPCTPLSSRERCSKAFLTANFGCLVHPPEKNRSSGSQARKFTT